MLAHPQGKRVDLEAPRPESTEELPTMLLLSSNCLNLLSLCFYHKQLRSLTQGMKEPALVSGAAAK